MKNFLKITRACLFAELVVCGLSFATSAYNLMRFYSVPEVSRLSMEDHGIVRTRNYEDRRSLVNEIENKEQKIQAKKNLDNLDLSNSVLAVSGFALIATGIGLSYLENKK